MHRIMSSGLLQLALISLAACQEPPGALSDASLDSGVPDVFTPAPDSLAPDAAIVVDEDAAPRLTAYEMVLALTSPAMTGRKSGTPGGERAARYIAERLAACGVQPFGDQPGSYYHTFKVTPLVNSGKMAMTVTPAAGSATSFTYRKQWRCGRTSPGADLNAPLVFAGFGLDDALHDDYDAMDVKGKIVIVLKGCPPPGGLAACEDVPKIQTASKHGAAGLILVADDHQVDIWGGSQGHDLLPIPAALIKEAAGNALLPAGKDLTTLRGKLTAEGPRSFAIPASLRLLMSRAVHVDAPARNVMGIIRGSPGGSFPAVLAGAHYDHLGFDEPPLSYFPGALDNASGTAVVIDAACRLARPRAPPRRRDVVVGLWAAEEDGLIGSRRFMESGLLGIEQIHVAFNLDMVGGVGDGPTLIRFSPVHRRWLEPALAPLAAARYLTPSYGTIFTYNSDHASFVQLGIPTVYILGPHPPEMKYHVWGDTAAQLDAATLDELGKFLHGAMDELAR